ncbi:phage virion morphogenesis protein [Bernardetia sp. Wsw4-3y2]|uniref:phage virion morphogenesis protein n=1 Tax=Bernardetia sp. Wsw4-3y2 TaxID=3127471 RepID=UPI0030D19CB7
MKKRDIKHLGNDIAKKQAELKKYLVKDFPRLVANDALQTFDDSWDKQGFTDEKGTFKSWEERKKNDGSKSDSNRGTLIGKGSGILRRSLEAKSITTNKVVIGTPVKYAQAHNEGAEIEQTISITPKMRKFAWAKFYETKKPSWRGLALTKKKEINRTLTIPKRQFMGNSKPLTDKIRKRLDTKMNKLFE